MIDLSNTLNSKIESNNTAIGFIEPEIVKAQEEIDAFTPYVIKSDEKTVAILNQINDLKNQIVILSANAYAVGCGTTTLASTVYEDSVDVTVENMQSESYTGDAPFENTTTQLTTSNVGVGSIMVHVPDNTSFGIGTLYASIDTCFRFPCVSGDCVSYASSITVLQNQITNLQSQLPTPIANSNAIKKERRYSQISRYGQKKGVKSLQDRNNEIKSAIQIIDSF